MIFGENDHRSSGGHFYKDGFFQVSLLLLIEDSSIMEKYRTQYTITVNSLKGVDGIADMRTSFL